MAEYIDKNEFYQVESLLRTSIVETDEVASFILEQVLYDIKNFPTADVAPVVRGKWFFTEYEFFTCSVCGDSYYNGAESSAQAESYNQYITYNYCPNCGAKMER